MPRRLMEGRKFQNISGQGDGTQSGRERATGSPEPAVLHHNEAIIDGDDYGVAAALEMEPESPYVNANRFEEHFRYEYKQRNPSIDTTSDKKGLSEKQDDAAFSEKGSQHGDRDRFGIAKMHKFSLYETHSRYYLVGGDLLDQRFRVLKIDRTAPPGQLNLVEDEIIYTKKEMNRLLVSIDDGNRAVGGLKLKSNAWGLLGFIRFTEAYYMLMVTKKTAVAMVGGHYIYQIDGTELVPLTTGSSTQFKSNRNAQEARFLGILNNLDLHRSFYYSYTYNVTRTLQYNIIREREKNGQSKGIEGKDLNSMFVWNHHLLCPAMEHLKHPYDWCLPIIHGFVDQSSINVFGSSVNILVIARRSRFFAGARFLKRGTNDLGYVANDVETEQIVANMLVTSFDAPGNRTLKNPNYTSFVQHRGSIPLFWTQDNQGVTPKPGIDLNLVDPFYSAAALHFDNMFERYSAPLCVLNLVKQKERTPRESKLLSEYQNAIKYLNQPLPADKKIIYRSYDMARMAKNRERDVIGDLEKIAKELVGFTGFFHNGYSRDQSSVQNGVIRSNCIDCLDRTNAAQFVIGKRALGLQLKALGVTPDDALAYDSDASNLFAHMFNDHGDTLASQYGGSHLVNTTDSYRKIQNWQSHSRDMLESFKRYYHNSFLDSQRQEAYNLFLGNYIFAQGQPMLWELPNDYYLHHINPNAKAQFRRRDYINWFTPEYLQPKRLPRVRRDSKVSATDSDMEAQNDWWHEYYRPSMLSSFPRVFSYRMNSTTRYLPKQVPEKYNLSPFVARPKHHNDHDPLLQVAPDAHAKDVIGNILDKTANGYKPSEALKGQNGHRATVKSPQLSAQRAANNHKHNDSQSSFQKQNQHSRQGDRSQKNQWTLRQFLYASLNPSVSGAEEGEYQKYLSDSLNLPLSLDDTISSKQHLDFSTFIKSAKGENTEWDLVDDRNAIETWLGSSHKPLSVTDGDYEQKRYQAYRKWLRGKSFFKQSKIDPEDEEFVDA